MRKTAALAALVALTLSGCGLFNRDSAEPSKSASPTPSESLSSSATSSATADIPLAIVVSNTRSAGGATVKVVTSLTGPESFSGTLAGSLSLDTGTGRADYTAANGRTSERIMAGGKTYTSAGSTWVATAQTGRGLLGGDLPTLWRLLSTMSSTAVAGKSEGSIELADALALASVDSNTAGLIKTSGLRADVSISYNTDGVLTKLQIAWSDSKRSLSVTLSVSDVGQVIEVTAPTEVVTGGPESQ